jgi:PAT family beta-lactamase induction signal transducer AmpG
LRRKLSIIALVYVIEGFPMGWFREFWSAVFRREGMGLTEIGLVSGLSVAWSLKVFWSPLVDRYGEERRWIAACLAAMTLCILAAAGLDMSRLGPPLGILVAAFCLASATQDVAIDAYTIRLVEAGEEGHANSMRSAAYRGGMILAGSLLILADHIGRVATHWVAAGLTALMALCAIRTPPSSAPRARSEGSRGLLRRWAARPGIGAVFGFVLLYRIGDLSMGPMVRPFWVDRGFSYSEIGAVTNIAGALVLVLGAVVGGIVVSRAGIGRALWSLGALALVSNLAYALAAWPDVASRSAVYAASVVESFCAGLAGNAFMSYLMNICEKQHAAVSYALLTAVYALPGLFAGAASGWATEQIGYAAFFAATGALALPAFALLPRAGRWIGHGA